MARRIRSAAKSGRPGLAGQQAQQMQRLGMVRLLGQNCRQIASAWPSRPGLMMLHRQIQSLVGSSSLSCPVHAAPLPPHLAIGRFNARGRIAPRPSAGSFASVAEACERSSARRGRSPAKSAAICTYSSGVCAISSGRPALLRMLTPARPTAVRPDKRHHRNSHPQRIAAWSCRRSRGTGPGQCRCGRRSGNIPQAGAWPTNSSRSGSIPRSARKRSQQIRGDLPPGECSSSRAFASRSSSFAHVSSVSGVTLQKLFRQPKVIFPACNAGNSFTGGGGDASADNTSTFPTGGSTSPRNTCPSASSGSR